MGVGINGMGRIGRLSLRAAFGGIVPLVLGIPAALGLAIVALRLRRRQSVV